LKAADGEVDIARTLPVRDIVADILVVTNSAVGEHAIVASTQSLLHVRIVDAGPAVMNAFVWNQHLIDAFSGRLLVMDVELLMLLSHSTVMNAVAGSTVLL
jgi:hypothetical protein